MHLSKKIPVKEDNKLVRDTEGNPVYKPNGLVVLTFEREDLPREVTLQWLNLKVRQHEPNPTLVYAINAMFMAT